MDVGKLNMKQDRCKVYEYVYIITAMDIIIKLVNVSYMDQKSIWQN